LIPIKVYRAEPIRYGYVDQDGKEIVPPRFDDAGDFAANGRARVEKYGRWFYIDGRGEEVEGE
jgi:hypothetical protein